MPISSATLSSILRTKKEFDLVNKTVDLTQLTDFAGQGIANPNTAKTLLSLIAPNGATVYQNAGFATDNYTSPDFTLVTTTTTKNLPVDINGDALTGTYTLTMKCQVVQGSDTTYGSAETTSAVCDCSVTISIDLTADYATAVLTSVDTTNYGAYFQISRAHTIYPPPISGLPSQATSATTNVYSNIVTTTWSSKITTTITYLYANDTYVECVATGSKEINVEADTLCETLCLIKKFRTDFYSRYGRKNTADMEEIYQLSVNEFALAMQAQRCGQDITPYINKIYELTGLDADCDCGCNDSFPTPVVPTSIVNGTNGTNGVTPQFQNTGTWIQVSYDSGTSWTNLFSLASVTGASGAAGTNGTDGANGVAVLYNDITDSVTSGTSLEILKKYTLPAAKLSTDGSYLIVRAEFTTTTGNKNPTSDKSVNIYFNNTNLIGINAILLAFNGQYNKLFLDLKISRFSPTQLKVEMFTRAGALFNVIGGSSIAYPSHFGIFAAGGLSLSTTAYDITAVADSYQAHDITCNLLEITQYNFGTGAVTTTVSPLEFLIIAATTTYTFNGTVTAYNPNGINLIGKSVIDFILDGLSKSLLLSEYTFDSATGVITIPTAVAGAGAKIIYQ